MTKTPPSLEQQIDQIMLANMQYEGWNGHPEAKVYVKAKQQLKQLIEQEKRLARIDELERLNLYYLRHDSEGEHKLAAQFDKRIAELKATKPEA